MVLCFLDANKKNMEIEEQKTLIQKYILTHENTVVDLFIEDVDISSLIKWLSGQKNTILIANIVCLGTTLEGIKDNLEKLLNLGCTVISIYENYVFRPDDISRNIILGLGYAIDIRKNFGSIVTKKALAEKKAAGHKLGRRSPNCKRALEDSVDEIILRKKRGESNLKIARELGVSPVTLYGFYKRFPEIRGQFSDN